MRRRRAEEWKERGAHEPSREGEPLTPAAPDDSRLPGMLEGADGAAAARTAAWLQSAGGNAATVSVLGRVAPADAGALQRETGKSGAGADTQPSSGRHKWTGWDDPIRHVEFKLLDRKVKKGALAPKATRKPWKLFKEDVLIMRVAVSGDGVRPGHSPVIGFHVTSSAFEEVGRQWESHRVVAVQMRAVKPGRQKVTLEGAPAIRGLMDFAAPTTWKFTTEVDVLMDLGDFESACNQAHIALDKRFSAAISKVNLAGMAYNEAWVDQDTALRDAERAERLDNDLAWGIALAGVGGAMGGAVGGIVKSRLKDTDKFLVGRPMAKALGDDALTDMYKDVTKFAVRSSKRLQDQAAGKGPAEGDATPGDSTSDPSGGGVPAGGKGARRATGQNPVSRLASLESRLMDEKTLALGHLEELMKGVRTAKGRNPDATFTEDPMDYVQRDELIDTITQKTSTEKTFYLRLLWQNWLEAYSWVVKLVIPIPHRFEATPTLEGFKARHLRRAIEAAAKQCGENGDDWISRYAPTAKRRAEEEAYEKNVRAGYSTQGQEPPIV